MKIARLRVYRVDLPLVEGRYAWADGKAVESFDSTIVRLDTDEGLTGWGEVCPLGPSYLPAFPEGARAGIARLAPVLIGEDPRETLRLNRKMDFAMKGHPYAKSAIDMALWDIAGKAAGVPIATLFGGCYGDSYPLYRAVSQGTPEEMAEAVEGYKEEGYTKFQLKVGGHAETDIDRTLAVSEILSTDDVLVADANCGWNRIEAMRVVQGLSGVAVAIEQPCPTYEECLSVRRQSSLPMILDEVIDGLGPLLRAQADLACDAVNLKISKLGGLTRAKQARDLCVELGLAMTLEDSWGGDLVTAAISHLAASCPPDLLFSSTDFNSYVTVSICDDAPRRVAGRLSAPTAPGLGVTVREEALGETLLDFAG
jgi:L-alanine-DL-glutamate epimerase-like enolase superfamily enzyme